ncbi:MAG: hypothetical protein Q4F60_03590 [Candidatus Saccharibacteria bacterium]|nr:hypothetical protein [Candidatus Saccharibacteria bacterium]
MALVIVDQTTKNQELELQTIIINDRIHHLLYTGKVKTIHKKIDTYLKFPQTQHSIRQEQVLNFTVNRARVPGASPKAHLWKIHQNGRQYHDRADHLNLLLILPRIHHTVILKFSRRGHLDFIHRDSEKLYLGIHLNHNEIIQIKSGDKSLHYSAIKTDKLWNLIHPPIFFRTNPNWHSTKEITV